MAAGLIAAFALAVALSALAGEPSTLPGVALGWPVLLHVERAGALLGVVSAFALVAWRTAHGELPVRLGQLEYERAAVDQTAHTLEAQDRRIRAIELYLRLPPEHDQDVA